MASRSRLGVLVGGIVVLASGCGRTPFVTPTDRERRTLADAGVDLPSGGTPSGASGGVGGAPGISGAGGFVQAGAGGTISFPIDVENCSNGVLDGSEECDDGNPDGGDGCSARCRVETNFVCSEVGFVCGVRVFCGDGRVRGPEECDDGDALGGGCENCVLSPGWVCPEPGATCREVCGDGLVAGSETCDDGNTLSFDGCSAACELEWGSACQGTTCVTPVCGDGIVDLGEECDVGENGALFGNGTGCTNDCLLEAVCRDEVGVTIACGKRCGDGNVDAGELCDDGNRRPGDGCSESCLVEAGFSCEEMQVAALAPCLNEPTGCVVLPLVVRDFAGEQEASAHPDFQFLGANGRRCIPDASGMPDPAAITETACWTTDATPTCSGLVEDLLGPDGTPVLGADTTCECRFTDHEATGILDATNQCTDTRGNLVSRVEATVTSIASPESFADWYHFSENRLVVTTQLPLQREENTERFHLSFGSSTLETDLALGDGTTLSSGFFPLDADELRTVCNIWPYWVNNPACIATAGAPVESEWFAPGNDGQGVAVTDVQGVFHNFFFTSAARFQFVYRGVEAFEFRGNDDFWLFVNGVLVLDLGGTHDRMQGTVDLSVDPPTWTKSRYDERTGEQVLLETGSSPSPTLEPGERYELAMFHAQRHPRESDFDLTLDGWGLTRSVCVANCGDGIVEGHEVCDRGADNSDVAVGGCRTNCTLGPFCGDGVTDAGETCDVGLGNSKPYGGASVVCAPGCVLAPYCGDGGVDSWFGEQCDDGPNNGATECSIDCTLVIR